MHYIGSVLLMLALHLLQPPPGYAQSPADALLPPELRYNAAIPTPASVLGYPIGKWHPGHDLLVKYLERLDAASDRISMQEYGRTHEDRPLLMLTITAPENHARLKSIRQQHLEALDPNAKQTSDKMVVWQGFNVHGDEASAASAGLLYAYFLAAVESGPWTEYLRNTVILLDPCLNPDGYNRYAVRANQFAGQQPVAHPATREHNEPWPSSRTNHYLFDLNRDWLAATQPETPGRLRIFHSWKPHIVTDHHETESRNGFYFHPGKRSLVHPLTPEDYYPMAQAIGKFHAQELDSLGVYHYTETHYSDFNYGKGSTYPDANGGIGILFEQGSSSGALLSRKGKKTAFRTTIQNQFAACRSTLKAANALQDQLRQYQRDFFSSSRALAEASPYKAWVFSAPEDPERVHRLLRLLLLHNIRVHQLARDIDADGQRFTAGKSFVVPLAQPQYRMVEALFERRTKFKTTSFYDVSAWTLPLAMNIPCAAIAAADWKAAFVGAQLTAAPEAAHRIRGSSGHAYLLSWEQYFAPRAVQRLLQAKFPLQVADTAFSVRTESGTQSFPSGTVVIDISKRPNSHRDQQALAAIAASTKVDFVGVKGTLPDRVAGFRQVTAPRVAVLIGEGIKEYPVGTSWHLLDKVMNMPTALLPASELSEIDLSEFTAIYLPYGEFGRISSNDRSVLSAWVKRGGTLIASRAAVRYLATENMVDLTVRFGSSTKGAIVATRLAPGHPLAYGYVRPIVPVFRQGHELLVPNPETAEVPLRYTGDPLLSGHVNPEFAGHYAQVPAVAVVPSGQGRIVCFADDPLFRGFWQGTEKLFLNAIFWLGGQH